MIELIEVNSLETSREQGVFLVKACEPVEYKFDHSHVTPSDVGRSGRWESSGSSPKKEVGRPLWSEAEIWTGHP
jgi:hypothetical protein